MISSSKVLSLISRLTKPSSPHHAQFFVTRRCNYRCRDCNVWTSREHDELSTNDVKRSMDVLRDIGVIEIILSGGNPLLRDDIGEIVDYASKHFITTVYDNGSLAADKIDDIRNADFVAISLDTLDEKKNDYLKGVKGAWKRGMNAIETLKREGIHVGVSPTISQMNLYEIIEFTKFFVKREIPVWYCLYAYDYSFNSSSFSIGVKNDEYEITDRKTLAEVCDTLMKMKKKSSYIYITDRTLKAIKHLALTGERLWKCKALENFLIVDHLGRASGCHCRDPIASVFDLPKIWRSPYIERLKEEYRRCAKCVYLCYIFYSVQSGFTGLMDILFDQRKNIKAYLGK